MNDVVLSGRLTVGIQCHWFLAFSISCHDRLITVWLLAYLVACQKPLNDFSLGKQSDF